jgi:pantothenate kinase
VLVVEGNYLLLDEEPWQRFQGLFDVGIFISAPRETLMASLTERHRRGGKTPEVTARHIRAVDLPNAVRVASSVDQAQVVVYKADVQTIDRVEWRVTP